jgi:hypothetical protein
VEWNGNTSDPVFPYIIFEQKREAVRKLLLNYAPFGFLTLDLPAAR